MYPARTVTIPGYNWKVEIYEASLYELERLKQLVSDDDALAKAVMTFIKSWDCADKDGARLDITPDNLKKIPQSALAFVLNSLSEPFKDDDLKNAISG